MRIKDQEKVEEAITEYRVAIRLNPNYALPHNNLGNALKDQEKAEEAITEYRVAIRLKPDYAEPHNGLGNAMFSQGKLEEAIAEFREAIRLKPDYAIPTTASASFCAQGKLEEAIAEYRGAIRLKPDFGMAHNNWAWALVLQSQASAAAITTKGLCTPARPSRSGRRTQTPTIRWRWPSIVRVTGPSLAASGRSMELRKGEGAYNWFFQAMVRWQKGDKDEARKWFDKAVAWTKEKDPKNKELLQFWREASELMGQPGPKASTQTKSRNESSARRRIHSMKRCVLPVMLMLVLGAVHAADEITRAQRYRALVAEFQAARQSYVLALAAAETNDAKRQAEARRPKADDFARRFLELSKTNLSDTTAFDALFWITVYSPRSPQADEAMELLAQHQLEEVRLRSVLQNLASSRSPAAEKLLRAALDSSPHREIRPRLATTSRPF